MQRHPELLLVILIFESIKVDENTSVKIYRHNVFALTVWLSACRKSWSLVKEESTFIDWQRAKVQETTDEVRPGCHCPAKSQQCLLPSCCRLYEDTDA